MRQPFLFSDLPADLLRQLLLGFSGRPHLHGVATTALNHSAAPGDTASHIALEALLAAWGENPFDGNCAAAVAGNMDRLPPVPAPLLDVIKRMLPLWKAEGSPEAQAAMAGGRSEQFDFLMRSLEQNPRSLFWWHHLYEYCRIAGDWHPLAERLGASRSPGGLEPLFSYAMGNALLASGEPLPAAGVFARCQGELPLPLVADRLASAWLRGGKVERGAEGLRRCAEQRPWNGGLWLRLYEHEVGGSEARATLPGRTMVLAYSWNKGDDLSETLNCLAASDLENVQVRLLDNGSGDATPAVLNRFIDTFGADRADSVTMPVNVGAPAARNWLMALPEVRESDFVAYIDDDISLPADWLTRLGGAAQRYPDAGVWGCKVVDYHGPARVQCGEYNLTPTPEARSGELMAPLMLMDGDFGQADYIRPCASVTGCVHLFRTERLLETGPFDLRFSPTQYDDLERDLRMVLGGGYAVYQGFLAIPHKRSSGSLADSGRPESSNATGNLHKLLAKYEPEEFEAMAAAMDRVLLSDLQAKIDLIRSGGKV